MIEASRMKISSVFPLAISILVYFFSCFIFTLSTFFFFLFFEKLQVTYITFGVNHIASPEQFPVMSAETLTVSLKPSGFFEQNPSLDVPSLKDLRSITASRSGDTDNAQQQGPAQVDHTIQCSKDVRNKLEFDQNHEPPVELDDRIPCGLKPCGDGIERSNSDSIILH